MCRNSDSSTLECLKWDSIEFEGKGVHSIIHKSKMQLRLTISGKIWSSIVIKFSLPLRNYVTEKNDLGII